MDNKEKRAINNAIRDWEFELASCERTLKSDTASEELKQMARERIKDGKAWINKLKAK